MVELHNQSLFLTQGIRVTLNNVQGPIELKSKRKQQQKQIDNVK